MKVFARVPKFKCSVNVTYLLLAFFFIWCHKGNAGFCVVWIYSFHLFLNILSPSTIFSGTIQYCFPSYSNVFDLPLHSDTSHHNYRP